MKNRLNGKSLRRLALASCVGASIAFAISVHSAQPTPSSLDGLWLHTELTMRDGKVTKPLSGVFLFKNGRFIEQAIFAGTPAEQQEGMANSGVYSIARGVVRLICAQGFSINPATPPALSFEGNAPHPLTFKRDGDKLSITFNGGTTQRFHRINSGDGPIFSTGAGQFAIAGDHVLLVDGDAKAMTAIYGRILEQKGPQYRVSVVQAITSDRQHARYRTGFAARMFFDGKRVELSDGASFTVRKGLRRLDTPARARSR